MVAALTEDVVREVKARAMAEWNNTLVGHCNVWLSWSAGHEDEARANAAAREICDSISTRHGGPDGR